MEELQFEFSLIWSDLAFLYIVGPDRQRKYLLLSYPRKRLFINQQWIVSKNLSSREYVYRAVA
jgi:hypothetical protein